jgi:4-alpha-glucanotransferase
MASLAGYRMEISRSSGVLLPVSALPGPIGIGDLGIEAYQFIDWLSLANQKYWQILPTNFADRFGCPYSALSAFGGYPLLISLDNLVERKLLENKDLYSAPQGSVDYPILTEKKNKLLLLAYKNFKGLKNSLQTLQEFIITNHWAHDFCLFLTIGEKHHGAWSTWPTALKWREKKALESLLSENIESYHFHAFCQMIFQEQWMALREYATKKNISIIGDIPIFINYHSMDVWKNPELFKLNSEGEMTVVTGCPPDGFSELGQRWGTPNYNWEKLTSTHYDWWIKRIKYTLELCNILRIDHFRGFAATWEIPVKDLDARGGWWQSSPGIDFFETVKKIFPQFPIIVEDLGMITEDVHALRNKFNFPSMKILQFAFGGDDSNEHLPKNWNENIVAYSATHDCDTTVGWWEKASAPEKNKAETILGKLTEQNIANEINKILFESKAKLVLVQAQDILSLNNQARFNLPGTTIGNWQWRLRADQLTLQNAQDLKSLTLKTQRNLK